MKKIFRLFLVMVALTVTATTFAQTQTKAEVAKERAALKKLSKKELGEKATKTARKEAKKYEKEGWQVAPGALPLDKQLDKAYLMQMEVDDNSFPKYIIGEAMSVGENYDAAKMQALELAKQNLAGQIQTEVTALIESSVANKQLAGDEAVSLAESVAASKNLISQSIGRIVPVVETYRVKGQNKEVRVQVAYNSDMAKEAAKTAIRADLEAKGNRLHDQLDKVLGF